MLIDEGESTLRHSQAHSDRGQDRSTCAKVVSAEPRAGSCKKKIVQHVIPRYRYFRFFSCDVGRLS